MADTHSTGAPSHPITDHPDAPLAYSPTPAASVLPRRAAVSVCGAQVLVDCPPWCVAPHDVDLVSLDDLCHEGPRTVLAAPTYSAGAPRSVDVLAVNLAQYPFSGGSDARPHLVLDANCDGETAELGCTRALAFADQLAAHAAEIRRHAETLPAAMADEPEPEHERAGGNPDSLPPLPRSR